MATIKGQAINKGDGVYVSFDDHTMKEKGHSSASGKLHFGVMGIVQSVNSRKYQIIINTWFYAQNPTSEDHNTSSYTIDTRTIGVIKKLPIPKRKTK